MKALLQKIRQILRDRRTRRIFTRLVSTVAAIVVFVTTYALVLPAITMESEAACGIEAHQHDQSCYTDVLVCEIPESPGHVHDESCYSTKQKQVCQIEEHVHDSDCYDENGELICGKTEHQHGEDCFEEVRELVCGIPESPGHEHDDSCYQKVLTCGKEAHTHSAACYHVDTASQAATEAIAVASTESTGATASTGAAVAENAMVDTDSLNAPAQNNESENGLDSPPENSVVEGGLNASPDNSLSEKGTTALTDEVSADEPGVWTSKEAAADATAATAASTGPGAGVTGSTGSSTGGTAATAAPAGATDTMNAEAGYVPVLDELNFNNLLNKHTGIYYSRLADADSSADNETDGADAAANTGGTQEEAAAANTGETKEEAVAANTGETQAKESDPETNSGEKQEETIAENTGEAHEAATWNRIDKNTELKESDNLRLYLAYTIPAGSLNETNQTARYRLPGNIHLTDEQIESINTTVNGIAAQYVSYDTLEILDQEMYGKYLGIEAVEGTRTPSDDLNEYLANNGGQEFISATVKVENTYDENTGVLKAQNLVFTFSPYTIQKNQHQYDPEGKPTKAGEEVNGWLTIDVSTKQIDWEKADDGTQSADIIFVGKDKKSGIKEISTGLKLVETGRDSDSHSNKTVNTGDANGANAAAADTKQDDAKDSQAEDGTSDNTEKEPVSYPSVSFDDSITVSGGSLSTDTDAASGDAGMTAETEITVHVEADKDTFPEGTTMVLSAVSDEQMSTVAEAVEGAVDAPKTMGFHAVDISFRDAKGNEIEPLKPIRVSMTSDAIKRAVEDESTAPVVVHVSDPAADKAAADGNTDARGSTEPMDEDEAEGADDQHILEPSESTEEQASGSNQETTPKANIIETDTETKEKHGDTLTFDVEAFSVYAIVYTVDFHYEVNGKMYDFSIPGGGFVSLEHLVEALGIASSGENTENGAENTENSAENGDEFVGKVPSVDEEGENGTNYEQAIRLNEVEVSEATKKFVADVERVEFSNPELVWVGKVYGETPVGGIKENEGLEVEYSTDLTEEQIAEINAQTVEGGDWALISMQPFSSEETLTVTMKNGDQFVVKVTDAQPANTNTNWYGSYNDFERGNTNRFVIWGVGSDGKNYVLKTDGTTEEFDPNTIDTLGTGYLWTIEYGWNNGWDNGLGDWDIRYYIRPLNDSTKCLALNNGYISSENLVSSESSGTHLYSPYSRHKNQWDNNYTNNNAGWILEGWGWTRLNLGNSSHQFEGHQQYCSNINISRVQPPYTYDLIVRTDDYERGGVSGIDKGGTNRQVEETFTATTYSTSGFNKSNLREIKAVPKTQKWAFDHWELDGKTLYWDSYQRKIVFEENYFTEVYTNLNTDRASVINAGSLPVTFNGSTLTAYFKRNPNYEAPDDDKDGRPIDATVAEWLERLLDADFPLNKDATQKTAEVYDYENRIYRVDITAASNLYALDKNVKLGFILDVSASMKFPSQLNMVLNSNNTQTTTDPTKQLALQLNNINDNDRNKRWLDQSKTYYIIADKTGTATVDKIFYKNGSWRWTDASKNNDYVIDQNTKFHNSDNAGLTYPIYLAGDPVIAADLTGQEGDLLRSLGLGVGDPRPRAYYLQRSMRETTAELQQIMDKISVAANPNQASEVLIAWNTFCGSVNDSDHTFKSPANVSFRYSYDGGTSTQLALEDARSFGWGSDNNTSRFAILITDGAPQKSSVAIGNDVVAEQATALKNRGTANTADDITLVTLGLSMGDVRRGEILLYDIASRDQENVPYYYEAESGNELGLALAEVIRIAMANAIVEGNVTDTVNEAFYPVDKLTGLPLENGYVINLNGELIAYSESSLTSEQRNAGYGVISETNGTYSVTWTGQEFTWEGWHGTIYEKAREDFLGGNAVRTNDPDHAAVVTSTGYKLHTGDTAIPFKDSIKTAGTKEMETPRVNVNELQIEGNNTEWTVYLGESVDPLEQIKALYSSIRVNQVITNGIDTDGDGFKDKGKWDWITFEEDYPLYYDLVESASDARENETYGEQEFFYLSNLIKKLNGGNDIDWDRLIALSNKTGDENTGITFPYDLYGQDNPGWITIKLEKNHSVDPHATDQVGSQVETYTLTAFFSPLYDHTPVGLGGDGLYPYHTGSYRLGTYGNAPGTEEVTNEHKINVFAKKLEIEKADQTGNTITGDTATFVLYRKATQAELDDDAVTKTTLSELDGKYVAVQTLTTDGGVVTTEPLPLLADNEPYYMVETKAPAGYIMLTKPLKVTIDMAGHNTWTKLSDNSTSQTKPNPYVLSNWLQEATIKIWNPDDTAYDPSHTPVYDHTNDTTEASVVYKILNNAGYELPSTGGPGTRFFTILGSILTFGAGVLLWRRRRLI